jgi:hypothetical protein
VRGYSRGIYNETTPIVSDYLTRLMIRKAGMTSDYGELDCFDLHCYCIIQGELSKMEAEEAKKQRAKRGR